MDTETDNKGAKCKTNRGGNKITEKSSIRQIFLKILGALLAVIIIISFVLSIIRIMDWKLFWVIVIIISALAYWVIPWIKSK